VNSATPILKRVLLWGGILGLGIAVVGSIAGLIADAERGLVSGLIGALIAFGFVAITAVTVLAGIRTSKGDLLHPSFFAIVLGGWFTKFVVFLVLIVLLKDQPWINTVVLFLTVVVGVAGSLVVDVVVIARSRMPYVSDVTLPGEETPSERTAP
jgi:hypothetical protein